MDGMQLLRLLIGKFRLLSMMLSVLSGVSLMAQQTDLATMREKAREVAAKRVAEGKKTVRRVGTMKFGDAERLKKAREKMTERYLIKDKTKEEIERQTAPDDFTQTEAHLQLDKVLELTKKQGGKSFIPYLDIVADALQKETELKDTHYVFYHAADNEWRVLQDLYTQLYALKNKETIKDFIFLRFSKQDGGSAQNFLMTQMEKYGLPDDTQGENKAILLSVNLALFGNIGSPKECSWDYFMKPQSHKEPRRNLFEGVLDSFGASHKLVNETMSLSKRYHTDEQFLLQIFVPKEKVDEVGYIAWHRGVPAYPPLIESIERKQKEMGKHTTKEALEAMKNILKQKNSSLYQTISENIKRGMYRPSSFLKTMCNNPWGLTGVNDYTARLIFTPDVLLNPSSGVKIYRYTTLTRENQAEYENALSQIVRKAFGG